MAASTNIRNNAMTAKMSISDLDGNNSVNYVKPDELPRDGADQQQHSGGNIVLPKMSHNGWAEHRAKVIRRPQQQHYEHHERQHPDNKTRQFTLGRQHTDVTLDAQSLPDRFGNLLHDFRKIATDILLHKVGANHDVQVLAVDAAAKVK